MDDAEKEASEGDLRVQEIAKIKFEKWSGKKTVDFLNFFRLNYSGRFLEINEAFEEMERGN